ncbi:MAG: sulfatase-like hydrolase/transferase, partial [Planctomycetota bacterium]
YPDHPITRADWSNYLASVEAMDQKVGKVLERLEQEELLDKTVILFFGDHGRPHVRGKQWLYDAGLHVPLIMRLPDLEHAGKVRDRLVSLLDPMPTTLGIAGVTEPGLPGLDLLAEDWIGHEHIIAARDRCGDAVDRIRCVREERWKYIRNFHPERPYMQHSGYKKLSYPVMTLMNVLHAQGNWDAPFMAAERPMEELYDLRTDPHELHNLAGDPMHAPELSRLRGILNEWVGATNDQGAIDESLTVDMDALMQEKRAYYERGMQRRGLDPDVSDEEYLRWWYDDLGLRSEGVVESVGVAE